ncbi:hypothetical protein P3X46_010489 [Hevea brasiliensis]|uniref:Retrotransposon gag domain-containing protein n=1 Tax=Hevea brasiliensis TaxID=3981 RepID=A0ABQ9MG72_HEVBR|nr:hypothetical protein P3X46_010489 [Hevea brasiliensis]
MEIVNTQQKDLTVAQYYSRLKGLWDEHGSYSQIISCNCGAAKTLASEREKEKVHQFSDGMVAEGAAFTICAEAPSASGMRNASGPRDVFKLFCEHCKKARHTKETCFELHGYLEWWEKNKKNKGSGRGKSANISSMTKETSCSPIRPSNEEADWHG